MPQVDLFGAESNRTRQIRQFCNECNITNLVHFTRIENLRDILREGLLSRERLETRGHGFLFNDLDRANGLKNRNLPEYKFPKLQNVLRN